MSYMQYWDMLKSRGPESWQETPATHKQDSQPPRRVTHIQICTPSPHTLTQGGLLHHHRPRLRGQQQQRLSQPTFNLLALGLTRSSTSGRAMHSEGQPARLHGRARPFFTPGKSKSEAQCRPPPSRAAHTHTHTHPSAGAGHHWTACAPQSWPPGTCRQWILGSNSADWRDRSGTAGGCWPPV